MTAPESSTPAGEARSASGAPSGARLGAALQRVLPQHGLSAAVRRLARIRRGPARTALISAFVRRYRPAMQEALEADPFAYESFNALFTRSLKPSARPIDPDPRAVVSPVDGTVSQIGAIDGVTLIQAKGRYFGLDRLLAREGCAERFAGGSFATLYLAPSNYHRVHMPLPATLRAAWYVPGRLFSVNASTASAVDGLYARNERVVTLYESPAGSSFAMVLVGALLVGSIATVWHGDVTPSRARAPLDLPPPREGASLEKGAEMGRFNMGSTVILVLARGAASWLPQLGPGSPIRMGERLGRLAGLP